MQNNVLKMHLKPLQKNKSSKNSRSNWLFVDRCTKVSKTIPKNNSGKNEEISKELYISSEQRQKIIDNLRFIYHNNGISKNNILFR